MTDEFNPYRILGVRKSAGHKKIMAAFRQRSKETHPDVGGSANAFMLVRKAYFILSDEKRRRRFDKDGVVDDISVITLASQVAGRIGQLFVVLLREKGVFRKDIDIISSMKKNIEIQVGDLKKKRSGGKELRRNLEGLGGRISRADGANLFRSVIDNEIEEIDEKLQGIDRELVVLEAVQNELEHYDCLTEMVRQVTVLSMSATTSTTSTATASW